MPIEVSLDQSREPVHSRHVKTERNPHRIELWMSPNDREFRKMVEEIIKKAGGRPEALQLLAVPSMTLDMWRKGKGSPTWAARRAVWMVWAVCFHPERIQSTWDVITWGQFYKYPVEWREYPEDYSI